jgi:hypothetical protein
MDFTDINFDLVYAENEEIEEIEYNEEIENIEQNLNGWIWED